MLSKALLVASTAFSDPVPAPPTVPALSLGESAGIVQELNWTRYQYNLPELELDDQLTCMASIQAAWLDNMRGPCKHTDLAPRAEACGAVAVAGEVQGCGYGNAQDLMRGFLQSPSHRKMILDPRLKRASATRIDDQWVVTLGF